MAIRGSARCARTTSRDCSRLPPMRRLAFLLALLAPALVGASLAPALAAAAPLRPLAVSDWNRVHRLADPQFSPDGAWIAYVVGHVDPGHDRWDNDVWMARADGSDTRRLTTSEESETSPRFSPD